MHVPTFMSMTIKQLCITTTAGGQKFISWLGDHRKGITVHNMKFLKYVSWIKAYKHNCQGKSVWHATVTWQTPKIQPKVNGILLSLCRSVSFSHDTPWELAKTKTIIWLQSLKSNLIICTLQKTAYYGINFHENVFLSEIITWLPLFNNINCNSLLTWVTSWLQLADLFRCLVLRSQTAVYSRKLFCPNNNNNICDLYHTTDWCTRMEIMSPHTKNSDSSFGQGNFSYIYYWVVTAVDL